jgi:hypothetical protein
MFIGCSVGVAEGVEVGVGLGVRLGAGVRVRVGDEDGEAAIERGEAGAAGVPSTTPSGVWLADRNNKGEVAWSVSAQAEIRRQRPA